MQEPRREGSSSTGQSDGDANQSQKQSTLRGIGGVLGNPVAAALVTAASSLIIFSFNQVKQIDARLDELEKEARLLLTPNGTAAASQEAMEAFYGLQALKERVSYVEGKLHFHEK